MDNVDPAQRERQTATPPFVFIEDADAADYCVGVQDNGRKTTAE